MNKSLYLLCLCLAAVGCSKKEEKPKERIPVVKVAKATEKTVPYYLTAVGNTAAYQSVSITPQVSGEVTGYYFEDGANVEMGHKLYTIDPRPFQADLEQAMGQYDQAVAELAFNLERVKSYEGLVPDNYVSKINFEQFVTNAAVAEGKVKQFEGEAMHARVNLDYCEIYAPISGRCGRHMYDPGNVVTANQEDALVVINRITPLYAYFSVSEQFFSEIQKYSAEAKEPLDVEIIPRGVDEVSHMGKLDFYNNTISQNTGTITLRAILPNDDKALWPGQFIQAKTHLYMIPNAVLVPEQSVKRDTNGEYVFIAKEDHTVDQRRVKTGQQFGTSLVITKGVKSGESVVTEGQLMLYQGAKYALKPEEKKG